MTQDFQPIDGALVPRFAGIATFMRLPLMTSAQGLDVALYGTPWDGGTTNRAGARHGPREIRHQSSLMRRVHPVTRVEPYRILKVADVGDLAINPIDLPEALETIESGVVEILACGAIPLGAGGDHLTTLPVLRALGRPDAVGLIQFDAHSDTNDSYFGGHTLTHGTPFRRAIEEGVLDPRRTIQIGIRGSLYDPDEHQWAKQHGVRLVSMEEFVGRGCEDVMNEVRACVGGGRTYVSFDVDSVDPSMAPGTGTPEIGGFTTREALQLVRGLAGVNIVGADVVEVAPPFDVAGMTALLGATILFELICILAANRASSSERSGENRIQREN